MERKAQPLYCILCSLHAQLMEAGEQKDHQRLQNLMVTFGTLSEASEPGLLVGILTNLECAARDALMGEEWRSELPSIEMIKSAISTSE